LAAIIIPGQSGTYRHLPSRVTGLLADSGQSHGPPPSFVSDPFTGTTGGRLRESWKLAQTWL